MKNVIAFILLLSVVYAQDNTLKIFNDTFVPRSAYAGSALSGSTLSATYADTTRLFNTRGYAAVYVGVETYNNDSGRILMSYQPSKDGVNFETAILFDSVSFVDSAYIAYKPLPSNALGAYAVKLRFYGDANVARYSANPSTLVNYKVIRIPYNDVKRK